MSSKLGPREKVIILGAFASFLISFLVLRLSNFSASTMVNSQNYIVETLILNTSGMTTLNAIYTALNPFTGIFISLVFFVLALSFLSFYGYNKTNKKVGVVASLLGALIAIVLFPTIWGVFLAASVFMSSLYSVQLSNTYAKELKRWIFFRVGSNTAGKALFVANIIISIGLFFAVLSAQSAYESAFRQDLASSMKSIALSIPGASLIPSDVLNQRIESAVSSSPLFTSYIRWLPVTTAFSAWVLLEILRNIFLSNISGIFTYLMLKKSK